MFSTPKICCSIGAATVSETTEALAPGYTHETWTVGGVISGYCAMGSCQTNTSPASVIRIEMTAANMGRSMKNRESITGLLRWTDPDPDLVGHWLVRSKSQHLVGLFVALGRRFRCQHRVLW